jgi:hypothetical protein
VSPVPLSATTEGERWALAAAGTWTAENAPELEDDAARRHDYARTVDIGLTELERLDTFRAWLIERPKRAFARHGSSGGTSADRSVYRVVFVGSLAGLRTGSAVQLTASASAK